MNKLVNKLKNIYRTYFWTDEQFARWKGVKIGKDCRIDTRRYTSEAFLIEIGDHCRIASRVSFYTHGGLWSQRKKHPELDTFGKIKIGNYTYIGEDAKIMPGVRIGNDVIVGAGTIVTKSVPDGVVVAGSPAKIVGYTKDFVQNSLENSFPTYKLSKEEKIKYLKNLTDDKFSWKGELKK